MKKPVPIQITIPEPCTQAWDDMQPVQEGRRHCGQCQKVVADFTRFTDAELVHYFQQNGIGCGRYREEQLNQVIKIVEAPKSYWWAKLAAGVLLASLSKSSSGQPKNSRAPAVQHALQNNRQSENAAAPLSNGYSKIHGILKDYKGIPIHNAEVIITEGGIQKRQTFTDKDGRYSVYPVNGGRYNVKFSYLKKDLTITNVVIAADQIIAVNGKLQTTHEAIKGGKGVEVHAVRGFQAPIIDPENSGSRHVMGAEQIEKAPTRSTYDWPKPTAIMPATKLQPELKTKKRSSAWMRIKDWFK
jgi:hypothetical protein